MSISPRQMWTNMAAATNSRAATLEQLANVEANWTTAKEDRSSKEQTFLEAEAEMVAEFPDDLPRKAWKQLQSLNAERQKANERFELVDRDRRKLVKLRDDQTESLMKLCDEYFGEGQRDLDFDGDAPTDGPLWAGVQLVNIVGPMMVEHYTRHGIATIGQAKAALEGQHVKQLINDGHLSKDAADFLKAKVVWYLDTRGVEHALGKVNQKKVAIPDAPAKVKDEGAVEAKDGPAAIEISNPEWDEACGMTATVQDGDVVPIKKPLRFLERDGERFIVTNDEKDGTIRIGLHVVPRAEWEALRPDAKPPIDKLLATDAGEVVVIGQKVIRPRPNRKPAEIPAAKPTPGKKKHRAGHVKDKAGRARVRREAEAK